MPEADANVLVSKNERIKQENALFGKPSSPVDNGQNRKIILCVSNAPNDDLAVEIVLFHAIQRCG